MWTDIDFTLLDLACSLAAQVKSHFTTSDKKLGGREPKTEVVWVRVVYDRMIVAVTSKVF